MLILSHDSHLTRMCSNTALQTIAPLSPCSPSSHKENINHVPSIFFFFLLWHFDSSIPFAALQNGRITPPLFGFPHARYRCSASPVFWFFETCLLPYDFPYSFGAHPVHGPLPLPCTPQTVSPHNRDTVPVNPYHRLGRYANQCPRSQSSSQLHPDLSPRTHFCFTTAFTTCAESSESGERRRWETTVSTAQKNEQRSSLSKKSERGKKPSSQDAALSSDPHKHALTSPYYTWSEYTARPASPPKSVS